MIVEVSSTITIPAVEDGCVGWLVGDCHSALAEVDVEAELDNRILSVTIPSHQQEGVIEKVLISK